MKKHFLLLVLVFSLFSTNAMAVPLTVNYTSDNATLYYATFQWPNNMGLTINDLGTNATNWQQMDSSVVDVAENNYVAFLFVAENSGTGSQNNPGGFLADISLGGSVIDSTSSSWYAASGDFFSGGINEAWSPAVEYGANGDNSTIWYNVNGGSVSGISDDAQWIWTGSNFSSDMDQVVSFGRILDVATDPVPEPATLFLLGTGLIGLAALSRKKMIKV